ncbi:MAG TPA: hypothetical protein VNI60_02180 [Pyrinomonadaceae bacterium]|nr:hypothetical protein [Pyrinomonadaceae bacterium]
MNETITGSSGTAHHHLALDARMVEEHCRTLRMPTSAQPLPNLPKNDKDFSFKRFIS